MSEAGNQFAEIQDTRLKLVELHTQGNEPLAFQLRSGRFYAPIEVSHDIQQIRLVAEGFNSKAKVAIQDIPLTGNHPSAPIALSVGRNIIEGKITAEDGKTTRDFCVKIFRAFPTPCWQRIIEQAPWPARDSAGELVFNNRMWLLGGYIPDWARDVWSSADGATWQQEVDVPSKRGIDIPIAFVFDNKMWIADVDGVLFSSGDGKSWTIVTDNAPWRGRSFAGAVVFHHKIWIMGGSNGKELLNDIWSSSDGIHWTLETKHAAWSARQFTHTPLVLDGKIWLLGGGANGAQYHPFLAWNDVWCSADGKHWEQVLEHAPWQSRIWGSTAVYRDQLWLMGGFRSEPKWVNLGDVWHSIDGVHWHQLQTPPTLFHSTPSTPRSEVFLPPSRTIWEQRHEQSVYAHDGSLWLAGGMIWPLVNDVWRLTIKGLCFVTQPVQEIYTHAKYEYAARADFNHSRKPVRYRMKHGPVWININEITGVLSGIAPQPADFEIAIEAFDADGERAEQVFTLHVLSCY